MWLFCYCFAVLLGQAATQSSTRVPPPPRPPRSRRGQTLDTTGPTADSDSGILDPRIGVTLTVEPLHLNFGRRPLCIANIQAVDVGLPSTTPARRVDVINVSTSSSSLMSSPMEPFTLYPGEQRTVNVILLPREVGRIEGEVWIQTSAGRVTLTVRTNERADELHVERAK